VAGIYIHIPFCRQACHYCNFHFTTSLRYKNEFVTALLKEIELQADYLTGDTVETIYFGGGTPSLLHKEEVLSIIQKIKTLFIVSGDAEITLETNPDDITAENLTGWKQAGINRLSIGIQSFFEEDLQWMNRAHTAKQSIEALQLVVQQFNNITIDLIYGTPGLTNEKWKQNVDTAIALNIPHISCYALTVEPKTPLDKMIRLKRSADINPDKQSEQFLLLMEWMHKAGYEHYEISNFAKPGWRSRHNSSYWQGKKYVGLGPSAHSFNGIERKWNVANNNTYIESIMKEIIPAERELLTTTQQLNEYIMTSLRTMEGIDLTLLQLKYGVQENEILLKAKRYTESRLAVVQGNCLRLTNEGKLLADGIAADLFY
jgi:oxygen-independent coproporphyrinogen III oxidase